MTRSSAEVTREEWRTASRTVEAPVGVRADRRPQQRRDLGDAGPTT